MYTIDTSHPVLVTGATGYVAGWIVKLLLEAGVTVHAAVRNPDDTAKVSHLKAMGAKSPGEIRFFKADLLDEGSYAQAMADCAVVFHTASPFTSKISDPQTELVDPALLGTRNVLNQASKTPSVKRVVLTSSCVAIYGDNADLSVLPGGVLTEEVWNMSSSLQHQAYSYSKTVAEREAWMLADAQDQWDLVTINPSLVIGPGTKPTATSESFSIVKQLGDGTMSTGAPRYGIGVVDVREVAEAHLAAAFLSSAQGRHILSGTNTDFLEMGLALSDRFGKSHPLPKRAAPKFLIWLIGPLLNKNLTRKVVSLNVDVPWKADNSKSIRDLGINYRPMQESLEEMFQQMIDSGQVKRG